MTAAATFSPAQSEQLRTAAAVSKAEALAVSEQRLLNQFLIEARLHELVEGEDGLAAAAASSSSTSSPTLASSTRDEGRDDAQLTSVMAVPCSATGAPADVGAPATLPPLPRVRLPRLNTAEGRSLVETLSRAVGEFNAIDTSEHVRLIAANSLRVRQARRAAGAA